MNIRHYSQDRAAMFKVIATFATAVAALFMLAGTANAHEITTSNDASGDDYSYAGTSNDTADTNTKTGLVQMPGVTHVWKVVGYDADGNRIWASVPISTGVAPATIVHN